ANRILDVAMHAGVRQLDYLLTTHYHMDHNANAPQVAAALPTKAFIDHGDLSAVKEDRDRNMRTYHNYIAVRAKGRLIEAPPGAKTALGSGVDFRILESAGRMITTPTGLSGSGKPNPLCREFMKRPEDSVFVARDGENALSVGTLWKYGQFSLVNFGDLVWNEEPDLVCPNNLIGEVSVYVTSVHGTALSGSETFVHALHPRIAVWNNGALKGSREAIQTIRSSPGLEDLWQLHYRAVGKPMKLLGEALDQGGSVSNAPDDYIANLQGKDGVPANASMGTPLHEELAAGFIKISARQ